jgi:hypothetical protein
MLLSTPSFELFDSLRQQISADEALHTVRDQAANKENGWSVVDQLLLKDDKIFVPASYSIVSTLLELAHGMGHEGIQKTLHRLHSDFHIQVTVGSSWILFGIVRSVNATKQSI